jgi:hypothetical protein
VNSRVVLAPGSVSVRSTGYGRKLGSATSGGVGRKHLGEKLKRPAPVWQEGIGSLLLVAAAQQTGLLEALVRAILEETALPIPGVDPPNPAVIVRLVLTLLLLPVAGLARTWDLRSYTGTLLAVVTGRPRAYSQRYTERFLVRLAQAGVAERLTEVLVNWTDQVWQRKPAPSEAPSTPAVFYVDGHRKAAYSEVLVPRGPIGKLNGKILSCRELVILQEAQAYPRLATTHRGDQHLTSGGGPLLDRYESATTRSRSTASWLTAKTWQRNFSLSSTRQGGRW